MYDFFLFLQCICCKKIARRMFRANFWNQYINRIDFTIIADLHSDHKVQSTTSHPIPTLFVCIFYAGGDLWCDGCRKTFLPKEKIISTQVLVQPTIIIQLVILACEKLFFEYVFIKPLFIKVSHQLSICMCKHQLYHS